MTASPALELESRTFACPVRGCEWRFHLPAVPGGEPNSFVVALAALEVLSHVVGGYGENGRTPHGADVVSALEISRIMAAAFFPAEVSPVE